jgi:nitroimidazol reductase NimA-like FMN-containing flavoprotein (pyridoxamine 5'-phosphate oxidase superfamily)
MSNGSPTRPTVRMSEDEIWAVVQDAHTGILTTLRSDGSPVALPVWFAVIDRHVYTHTRGKKLVRVRNNPVSSFLVEDGQRWSELRAVHLSGRAEIVEPDEDLAGAISAEMDRKYRRFRTSRQSMPTATRQAYQSGFAYVRFTPEGKVLNWNNAHLGII